jgi:hypothetical protein
MGSQMCLIIMVKYMILRWVLNHPNHKYHPRHKYDEVISNKRGKRSFGSSVSSLQLRFYPLPSTLLYIRKPKNNNSLSMAHHWKKKPKSHLVGCHDKEASSSRGHGRSTRVEKESQAAITQVLGFMFGKGNSISKSHGEQS